jgi:hypothetical protein
MREHLGPAMIYFTGNMYFNRALRHYCDKVRPSTYSLRTLTAAYARGWTLLMD